MAPVSPMKTPAETALARPSSRQGKRCRATVRARGGVPASSPRAGLPHRRVEDFKYTDLRAAMREAAPFAEAPSAAEAQAASGRAGRSRESDGEDRDRQRPFRARGVGSRPAAGGRRDRRRWPRRLGRPSAARADAPVARGARQPGLSAQHRLHDRRRCDPRRRRRGRAADPSALRHRGRRGGRDRDARARRRGGGRLGHAAREPRGPDGIATQLERRRSSSSRATAPRSATCGSTPRAATRWRCRRWRRSSARRFRSTPSTSVVGAAVSRHQVFLAFAGERSLARINGATMIKGSSTRTRRWWSTTRCRIATSRELFKTVVDGEATGVFQGKIIVPPTRRRPTAA